MTELKKIYNWLVDFSSGTSFSNAPLIRFIELTRKNK